MKVICFDNHVRLSLGGDGDEVHPSPSFSAERVRKLCHGSSRGRKSTSM